MFASFFASFAMLSHGLRALLSLPFKPGFALFRRLLCAANVRFFHEPNNAIVCSWFPK